jgi:transposase, IS5 family
MAISVPEVHLMSKRFRPTGEDSFFGDALYEMAVPKSHFLRQLRGLLDWEEFSRPLLKVYKGGAEVGGVPYHPSVLLRMLLLSYLYKLSERQVEEYVNDSLAAKYFLSLGVHQMAPDHSSLTVFKDRVLAKKGPQGFEELFQRVVRLAIEKGIQFGKIQIVDSTHTIADVDVKKDGERKDGGAKPRDPDAAWGSKGKKKVKTADGGSAQVNKSFYGYKSHMSLNAQSEIVTAIVPTAGNKTDGQQFRELEKRDEAVGVVAAIYGGDKGYDDGDNHELLHSKGKHSALRLNSYRTKLYPEGKWADMKASVEYQEGQKERYKIEQKNAEGKRRHGLDKCRYVSWRKYALQAYVTGMVLNFKRMVLLLCGVRLHGPGILQTARG